MMKCFMVMSARSLEGVFNGLAISLLYICHLPRADVHSLSLTFSLILSQFYISKVLHIRWISLLICVAQDGYVFCVGYW